MEEDKLSQNAAIFESLNRKILDVVHCKNEFRCHRVKNFGAAETHNTLNRNLAAVSVGPKTTTRFHRVLSLVAQKEIGGTDFSDSESPRCDFAGNKI